jgi:hypothetical protein
MPSPTDDETLFNILNHIASEEVEVTWLTAQGGTRQGKGFLARKDVIKDKSAVIGSNADMIYFYPHSAPNSGEQLQVAEIQSIRSTSKGELWHRQSNG